MKFASRIIALILAACCAGAVSAQDSGPPSGATADAIPSDWDLVRDGDTILATVVFTPGLTLVVRCKADALELLAMGLPRSRERHGERIVEVARGDGPLTRRTWAIARDRTVAVDLFPAATARQLRLGGRFRMRAEGSDRRHYLYDMTLPSSDGAIDEVLTACRRPLVDPDDLTIPDAAAAEAPTSMRWIRGVLPEPPRAMMSGRIKAALTGISCDAGDDGRLTNCSVESEYPYGSGIGAAAIAAAARAEFQWTGEGERDRRLHLIVRTEIR